MPSAKEDNVFLHKLFLELKVRCPNSSCSWSDEISRLDSHLAECNYQSQSCKFVEAGCTAKGNAHELALHYEKAKKTHLELAFTYLSGDKKKGGEVEEEKQFENVQQQVKLKMQQVQQFKEEIKEHHMNLSKLKLAIQEIEQEGRRAKEEDEMLKEQLHEMQIQRERLHQENSALENSLCMLKDKQEKLAQK